MSTQYITHSSPAIFFGYVAREFWRNLRMVDMTFFIIVLPAAMYLMFGVAMNYGNFDAGRGNVTAYVMTSMALYGAVTATTSLAGATAVERSSGWGRQLAMTSLSSGQYLVGKAVMALCVAAMPVTLVFILGAATGAEFTHLWQWFAAGGLIVLLSAPFAFYGLAAAMLFRSESAVGVASALLVVLAFFGNLFIPLSGTLLEISKFTPLYGVAALARWPQMEGFIVPTGEVEAGFMPEHDSLGLMLLNVGAWTLVFVLICMIASRRRTHR